MTQAAKGSTASRGLELRVHLLWASYQARPITPQPHILTHPYAVLLSPVGRRVYQLKSSMAESNPTGISHAGEWS